MKETGLMFKAPLVRAILSGQKTQTRRLVKPQPPEDRLHRSVDSPDAFVAEGEHTWWSGTYTQGIYHSAKCPFGKPGDRIYVRETFAWVPTACESDEIVFAADYHDGSDKAAGVRYIPSIHMPKAAARIWLEITGVRVERLQDISEEDAKAEGARFELASIDSVRIGATASFRSGFRNIWESTGGDWAANPWVWVIDFKRIEAQAKGED